MKKNYMKCLMAGILASTFLTSTSVFAAGNSTKNVTSKATISSKNKINRPMKTSNLSSSSYVEWQQYGDDFASGHCVQPTDDGGYLVGGYNGKYAMYLLKTDSNGNKLWDKSIKPVSADSRDGVIQDIKKTSDGNYLIMGDKSYLSKIDKDGNILWSKTISNVDDLSQIEPTRDGGCAIVGSIQIPNHRSDISLSKIDANGNIIFNTSYGTSNDDCGASIKQTVDGGYIILGTSFMQKGIEASIIKTDRNGHELWNNMYYSGNSSYANSLQITSDDSYIFAGGNRLNKIDNSGNLIWQKQLGDDQVMSLELTPNDGCMLTCCNFSIDNPTIDIIQTDSYGNKTWHYTASDYNAWDTALDIRKTNDSGYIVCGQTYQTQINKKNIVLIKLK
ncbi:MULTISPECIES: hypothetical protein [Clostridium]|uniref:hypothetical protein n=1 Tax=Clostridium TaxID=1485 RepID=UPI0008244E4E|nr:MULTISPECIES: hypothetical protein [Clostridium]PJI09916.1 hypothetical protein CUB90_19485 [Clostridium sp. CT7]